MPATSFYYDIFVTDRNGHHQFRGIDHKSMLRTIDVILTWDTFAESGEFDSFKRDVVAKFKKPSFETFGLNTDGLEIEVQRHR